jgi:carbon monoxide dehydrogenase subunit G
MVDVSTGARELRSGPPGAIESAMQINNEFEVRAPIDQVWAFMLDVEKVAPCVPGGQLTETVDDHTWKGKVAMKMGPVSLSFTGTVTIDERDDEAHRVKLKAEGREQRGKGAATATATSSLESVEGGTKVSIQTDLTITGAVAQYGRGMIGDISQKLTNEFAQCLQSHIGAAEIADSGGPAARLAEEDAATASVQRDAAPGPGQSADTAPGAPPSTPGPQQATATRPPTQARPVGGIRLGLWAFWRAVVRFFRKLFGRSAG